MQKKIIDNNKLKELHSSGLTTSEMSRDLMCCRGVIQKRLKELCLISNKPKPHRHSEEEKKILSIKRKQYLKANPDKHPWRNNNKFKSKPCEGFKEWLILKNIPYIPEYNEHGVKDRNFSIDIALPDKMVAIEINGNQHYNRDGTLKDYYKEREELLESVGWKVYQLHYSMCFKIDKLESLLLNLIDSPLKIDFDYRHYTKTVKDKKSGTCIDCGEKIYSDAKRCVVCAGIKCRKVIHPDKETLHSLIWSTPLVELGKLYGVSANAIKMWCKRYNLKIPDNKYRRKFFSGKIIDYQI